MNRTEAKKLAKKYIMQSIVSAHYAINGDYELSDGDKRIVEAELAKLEERLAKQFNENVYCG